PDFFAEQSHPAVFKFANRAKRISLVRGLIGVEAVLGKFSGKSCVVFFDAISRAKSKSFRFESLEQLLQCFLRRLGNHDAARAGFAKRNLFCSTKIPHTIQVAEEIENKGLSAGQQRKNRRP